MQDHVSNPSGNAPTPLTNSSFGTMSASVVAFWIPVRLVVLEISDWSFSSFSFIRCLSAIFFVFPLLHELEDLLRSDRGFQDDPLVEE